VTKDRRLPCQHSPVRLLQSILGPPFWRSMMHFVSQAKCLSLQAQPTRVPPQVMVLAYNHLVQPVHRSVCFEESTAHEAFSWPGLPSQNTPDTLTGFAAYLSFSGNRNAPNSTSPLHEALFCLHSYIWLLRLFSHLSIRRKEVSHIASSWENIFTH
jgi:hypothetical protein